MTLDPRTERLAHAVLDGREAASVEWLRETLRLALAEIAEEREDADRLAEAMGIPLPVIVKQGFFERWLVGDGYAERFREALAKHRERRP